VKGWSYIGIAALTLAAMAAAAVPATWGTSRGLRTMFNAPFEWVNRDYASIGDYYRFVDQFRMNEMVLVSWPGCTVNDPRLVESAEVLMAVRDSRAEAGETELFNRVLDGHSMLRMLMDEPADLSRTAALRRLQGSLIGPDGQTSCLIVILTEDGSLRRKKTIALILDALQDAGHPREDLRLAGTPVDGLATDEESVRSLERYCLPSVAISLVLCCLCLRSVWLSWPILAVGALGQGAMLASIYFCGITMNAILIVLPALVFVLTVSAGVHLVNYFYDELRGACPEAAITRALHKGWGPCTLAAVTTAIGLGSLMVSDVGPVRHFGALAACGVLGTLLLLFLVLPGAMQVRLLYAGRRAGTVKRREADRSNGGVDAWERAAGTVCRFASWISIACLLGLMLCGAGLFWLRSSVNTISLLSPESRVVRDYRWFEKHIGPLVPVEVVLRFDPTCTLDQLQRMELVQAAQDEIGKIEILDGAMSAASFFPTIPRPGGLRQTIRRTVLRRMIESRQEELVDSQYLHIGDGRESWRISARVSSGKGLDYQKFPEQLRGRVGPVISDCDQCGDGDVQATYTGVTQVVHEIERALLGDLFDSFLTALVLITIVMAIALRSIPAGLVAMVPNVFPTAILFGTMGWLGRAVDIGTVMTASVALGVAVDGTCHFLKWFRHEMAAGRSRHRAVAHAYRHCGRALVQTTVICALGMLIFTLSGFLPVRNFSVMFLLLLVAALVGDLVVLPALLVGPLGKWFVQRKPVS
jgi:predicted RND superfamily exporter protein